MTGTVALETVVEHVLVIGDEAGVWDAARSALRRQGYRVSQVPSRDALDRLEQDRPDLAIVDSALRQVSAAAVTSEARRRAIPVLLAGDAPALDGQLSQSGVSCLRKPFAERELLERSRCLIAAAGEGHSLLRASMRQMRSRIEEVQVALSHIRTTIGRIRRGRAAGSPARRLFQADPILREALACWRSARGERVMPRRRDIDPAELPFWLLPHLHLTDVVEGGQRFRYRLVGAAIIGAFGAEFTGKHVDELAAGEHVECAQGFYRTVCNTRKPVFARGPFSTMKGVPLIANRLLLPLSEDGEAVSTIAGALTFEFDEPFPQGAAQSSNYLEILS